MRITRLTRATSILAAVTGTVVGAVASATLLLSGPGAVASEPDWQPIPAPDFEQMLRDEQLPLPDLPPDFGEDSYLQRTYGYTFEEALTVLSRADTGTSVSPLGVESPLGRSAPGINPDPGYEMWRPLIQISGDQRNLYYGAVVNFANVSPEVPAFCLDLDLEGPQGGQGSSQTVDGTELDSLVKSTYSPPARYDLSSAELSALLASYGTDASAHPVSVAAVSVLTHANFETSSNADGYLDAYLAAWESNRADQELGTTAAQRAMMIDSLTGWARSQTPTSGTWARPTITIATDQRHGTVGDIGVKNGQGGLISDLHYTVTLSGPASFEDGRTEISGTTSASPISHSITLTGNGSVSAKVSYTFPTSLVTYSEPEQAGVQRTFQTRGYRPSEKTLVSDAVTATFDFQPVLSSQTTAEFIDAGSQFIDDITLEADPSYANPQWIKLADSYVPATVTTNVYWSLTAPTTTSASPTSEWEVVETVPQTFDGPGTRRISVEAGRPGYYVAQSMLTVADQPKEWQSYFAQGAQYEFGLPHEMQTAQIKPVLSTTASDRLALPEIPLSDAVTISLTNGAVWPDTLAITARGTLYGPFDVPQGRAASAPIGAPIAQTASLTFTSNEQTLLTHWTPNSPGFYTWVWTINPAQQTNPALIKEAFTDDFMIHAETTAVRIPLLEHRSQAREYNVTTDGRAFDTITIAGFMASHGDFTGDDYWGADLETARVTVYDVGVDTDWTTIGSAVPASAAVHWKGTVPAKNGTFQVGYDDDHPITDFKAGHDYVFIYRFEGDDRVAAYTSAFDDIYERFHVPGDRPEKPTVATQATEEVRVGEPLSDTALVSGDIRDGSYLIFEAFGPQTEGTPTCDGKPFFTSEKITVSEPGYYRSGATATDRPGNVYWIETLYSGDGSILAKGTCGIPSETTRVIRPDLITTATDADDGGKTVATTGTVRLNDHVCYTGLLEGKEYTILGTLMDKSSGRPLSDAKGRPVTATTVHQPMAADGCADVLFEFDGSILQGLSGGKLVAFEEVRLAGIPVAVHADLEDDAQTVTIQSQGKLAKTGWGHPLLGALAIGTLGLGTILLIATRRYRF